jgi:hypothetical protein
MRTLTGTRDKPEYSGLTPKGYAEFTASQFDRLSPGRHANRYSSLIHRNSQLPVAASNSFKLLTAKNVWRSFGSVRWLRISAQHFRADKWNLCQGYAASRSGSLKYA